MRTVAKLAIAGAFAGIVATGAVVVPSIAAGPSADASRSSDARLVGQIAPGLIMPAMDPVRGKRLFASKGCVVCHSINGVGGTDAAKLDAATMQPMMNPFEFFAKMWRGAIPMISMQQHEVGHQIEFTGQDLADIVAFVHNPQVQKTFTTADIPPAIKKHMEGDADHKGNGEGMRNGTMGGQQNMMGAPSR